jgi:S-adenosylmethionine-diacylgycerolhomoserine-N-methlytransferase
LTPDQTEHRIFLNRYYRAARPIYDITRKYYLFGRDRALAQLLSAPWASLVEVGPGTGRNLELLHRGRPWAQYGGIEASDAMLERAAVRCPWARFTRAFAEDADYSAVLGHPPQRILFSYCLSMVQRREQALQHALASVAPGGEVWVVDFADLNGLPAPLASALRAWLRLYRVEPLTPTWLEDQGASLTLGPCRYYALARLRRPG